MKFRKKPVIVEAVRWFKNGDHPNDYAKDVDGYEGQHPNRFPAEFCREHGWEGQVVRYFRRPDVRGNTPCKHCGAFMHDHGWIDTPQGGHTVCPGDWIISEPTRPGEYYPCKPDAFQATYEPVGEQGA